VLAGLLGFALLLLWLATDDRMLQVIPGEIMRSGRLDGGELQQAIERLDLRTVVSLTGSGPEDDWVGAERELCASLGVHHVTLPFSVDEWPGRPEVEHVIRLLEEAERPLLFHCLRGVDRSGWASAVALLLADAPVERALRQMSPRNGHLCDPGSCPLHRFFKSYLNHLSATGRPEGAASFRQWVAEIYCPEPYNAELELLTELPPPVAAGETLRLTVRVTNRGADNWRMTDNRTEGVRLGARLIGPFAELPADPIALFRTPSGPAVDIARAGLEAGVMPPGSRRDFDLRLRAPRKEGRYLIQIDMVDERINWFSDLGWPGLIRELEVVATQ
jgi:undecaprenyl-diphosphatase